MSQDQKQGTAVAAVSQTGDAGVDAIFQPGKAALVTSLPMTTIEEKIAVAALAADDTDKFADLIGEEVCLLDVLIHPVEITDKRTGEVKIEPRSILVTDRGPVAAVSRGVIAELGKLAAMFGTANTWRAQGGVWVKCKQVNTGSGFRTYKLIPVIRQAKPKSGK